jgi:hypothetical protein
VDLLFSPRQLARAVVPWLAVLLAVTGIASVLFEGCLVRPEVVRFARQGRRVQGTVVSHPSLNISDHRNGGHLNRSLVGVNDEELGDQVVSIYGALRPGTTVPLLCLTPVHHCMSAGEVRERLDLWPLTPLMLAGAAELALAVLLAFAAHRGRRSRGARGSSTGLPAAPA